MRILYVFRSLAYWGGIERILVDKMNNLVSMYGYEVYMLTTDQGCHPVPYQLNSKVHLEDLGIRIHQQYNYHGLKRIFIIWKLYNLYKKRLSDQLRKIKPDVIVCTTSNYWDVNVITQLKGSVPLVIESHSIFQKTLGQGGIKNRFSDFMYKRGLSQSQVIVALTEKDASDWRKIHPCVKTIPNMAHLNDGSMSSLKNKRVIWVGRLDYQKRPLEMIEMWKSVSPKFSDWHLDMYGEGELLNVVEEKAKSLNMNIHIHQPTSNIFDCYRNSSFLVSTSLFEPFGLVIPEAMSCGLPVVSFDCPYGPADIITDGEDGFLVKNGDVNEFVEKVCHLIEDKELRVRMGHAASLSSNRFSTVKIMRNWKSLFERMVNC